jgi:hypothetical protein
MYIRIGAYLYCNGSAHILCQYIIDKCIYSGKKFLSLSVIFIHILLEYFSGYTYSPLSALYLWRHVVYSMMTPKIPILGKVWPIAEIKIVPCRPV